MEEKLTTTKERAGGKYFINEKKNYLRFTQRIVNENSEGIVMQVWPVNSRIISSHNLICFTDLKQLKILRDAVDTFIRESEELVV